MDHPNPLPSIETQDFRVSPTKAQLFMFSAVTWNRHGIHFDRDQAEQEGFPDVVVQRGLLGNFLARFVETWAGPQGRLDRLQWRVLRSAFPGQELRIEGEGVGMRESKGERHLDYTLRILNPAGERVVAGECTVSFPGLGG